MSARTTRLSLFIFVLIFLLPQSSVFAATLTVDDPTGAVIPGNGLCSLPEAITNANFDADFSGGDCVAGTFGADFIQLATNVTLTTVNNALNGNNGLPSVISPIIVEGFGLTIQRDPTFTCPDAVNPEFRIFHVFATGSLTLDDVTVANGCANDLNPVNASGGGVFNVQGTVNIINNSVLLNNRANAFAGSNVGGGGLFNVLGAVTVTNSTINGNFVLENGGGILSVGGTIDVDDSLFTGNTAFSGNGAGLANGVNGVVTIDNSTFISNNSINDDGGAIGNALGGDVTLTDSIIGTPANPNTGGDEGGAIFNRDAASIFRIINTTIDSNTCIGCLGGGITNENSNMTITDSDIINNTADDGGGIYNFGANATIGIQNTTFNNNSAVAANGNGGAIYNISNTAVITISNNTTFTNNSADIGGAISRLNGGAVNITDTSFTTNTAGIRGGAIYTEDAIGSMIITGSSITSNSAVTQGGGISLSDNATVNIDNTDILNNDVIGGVGVAPFGGGGVHSNNNTNLTITNSMVNNNRTLQANYHGGGIFNGQGAALTLTNTTVSGNQANDDGGGLYFDSVGAAIVSNITNSTISGNSADDGGGIFKQGSSPVNVTQSTLDNNTARENGGGIYNDSGVVNVSQTTISNNNAQTTGGGGFFNLNTTTTVITTSTFSGNRATGGGGEGGGLRSNMTAGGTIDVNNSTFSGNSAAGQGGGIHNDNMVMNLINLTITGNTAPNDAGIFAAGTVNIANTILAGNTGTNPNCGGSAASYNPTGTNLTNDNTNCPAGITLSPIINLDILANNGGPTETHALLVGSSAIDTGNAGVCAAAPINNLDQRGMARPVGAQCDVGSYEGGVVPPTISFDVAISNVDEGNPHSVNVTMTNPAGGLATGTVDLTLTVTGTATGSGTDYTMTTVLPLTFSTAGGTWPAPGATETLMVDFTTVLDTMNDPAETIILDFTQASITGPGLVGAIIQHTVTLNEISSDLEVLKTVGFAPGGDVAGNGDLDPGDTVQYAITVTNLGPTNATDITIEDALSANLDIAAAVVNAPAGTVYNPVNGEWSADGAGVGNGFALANAASQTLTVDGPILAGTEGQNVPNQACVSVAFPAALPDSDAANNCGDADFTVSAPVPPPVTGGRGSQQSGTSTDSPRIDIFDPAISKIGILFPGQLGLAGEQLEWKITVTNNGGVAANNILVTDTLRSELQIDSVSGGVSSNVSGQTVTVSIPLLSPGQSVIFSIFTTVLQSGIVMDNTACLTGGGKEVCVTSVLPLVRELPATGESPWWRMAFVCVGILLCGLVIIFLRQPRNNSSDR